MLEKHSVTPTKIVKCMKMCLTENVYILMYKNVTTIIVISLNSRNTLGVT